MTQRRPAEFSSALLAELSEPGRTEVLGAARLQVFGRGERLVRQGDEASSLFIITQGRVAVRFLTQEGESVTLSVLGLGAMFGEVGLLDGRQERTATVQALDGVSAYVLRREDFSRLRERHFEVNDFLLQMLARRVDRLSHLVAEAHYLSVDKRVARRLYEICSLYGREEGPAIIPLTQDEVAQIAGTTRPTANQVLKRLEARQVLEMSRAHICVIDPSRLRTLCSWI